MLTTEHISHGNYAIKALTGLVVFGSTENRAQPDKQFADGGYSFSAGSIKRRTCTFYGCFVHIFGSVNAM